MGERQVIRRVIYAMAAALAISPAGCGGGAANIQSTASTQAAVVATTKAPTALELKAEARRRRREAAAKERREADKRMREAAERHKEAIERHREEDARKLEEQEGYGLGATRATFEAHNTMASQEGSEPPEGTDYYRILETRNGRVIADEVTIYASPPFSNQERMGLLGGVDLPHGAEPLPELEHGGCYVWRSSVLKRLVGGEYAEATTESGTTTARMEAVSSPRC
jgi:hypothetical protein